ncbi:hypothetical protein ACKVMH_11410, partial [Lysobacter zhanggongensis]
MQRIELQDLVLDLHARLQHARLERALADHATDGGAATDAVGAQLQRHRGFARRRTRVGEQADIQRFGIRAQLPARRTDVRCGHDLAQPFDRLRRGVAAQHQRRLQRPRR